MLMVNNLRCERGQGTLFNDLSFSVSAGEILQIRGANGAGKTTLLRILSGLYHEYEGEVEWQLDKHPLYLGHKPGVKDLLTCQENLAWLCELHEVSVSPAQIETVLSDLGLRGYEDVPTGKLSEGQRKRVNLARFCLLDSPVWLLDEPFSAIDVDGIAKFESLMRLHVSAGGSILFASHQQMHMDQEIRSLNLSRSC